MAVLLLGLRKNNPVSTIFETLPPVVEEAEDERPGFTTTCWGKMSAFEQGRTEEKESDGVSIDNDCDRIKGYADTGIREYFMAFYGCEEDDSEEDVYDEIWRRYEEVKIVDTGNEENYAVDHRIVEIQFKRRKTSDDDKKDNGFLGNTNIISGPDHSGGGNTTTAKDTLRFIYKHPALGEVVGEGTQGTEEGGDGSPPDTTPPQAA